MIKIIHFNTHEEYIRWVEFPGNMQIVYETHMVSYCDAHTNVQIVKSRFHKQGCVSMKRYAEMVQETIIGRILTNDIEYKNNINEILKQKSMELWEHTFKEMLKKDWHNSVDIANNVVSAFNKKFKSKD